MCSTCHKLASAFTSCGFSLPLTPRNRVKDSWSALCGTTICSSVHQTCCLQHCTLLGDTGSWLLWTCLIAEFPWGLVSGEPSEWADNRSSLFSQFLSWLVQLILVGLISFHCPYPKDSALCRPSHFSTLVLRGLAVEMTQGPNRNVALW